MKRKDADKENKIIPAGGSFLLYSTEDGREKIEVRLENETVWMTQSAMAELFQTTKQNISLHLKNIFTENELNEERVVKENLTTAADGKKYSTRGTQFRIWATERLNEYLVKGFAMDDDRLKEGPNISTPSSWQAQKTHCC